MDTYLDYLPRDIIISVLGPKLDSASNFTLLRCIHQDDIWCIHPTGCNIKSKIVLPDNNIRLPIVKTRDMCYYDVKFFEYFNKLDVIRDRKQFAYSAAMNGNVELLDHISQMASFELSDMRDIGIGWGYIKIIEWVYKRDPINFKLRYSDVCELCRRGLVDCFKYIYSLNVVELTSFQLLICGISCIECNSIEMLECMKDLIIKYHMELSYSWFNVAIKEDRLNIIKWFVSIGLSPFYKNFRRATELGKLEIVKYLDDIGCPRGDNILAYASEISIIEYLSEHI